MSERRSDLLQRIHEDRENGVSWQEIADKHGDRSAEGWRSWYSRETTKLVGDPDTEALIRDLGRKNESLQSTVTKLRSELRAERAAGSSYAMIADAIREGVTPLPAHPIKPRKRSDADRTRTAVLNLGDWHSGEVVLAHGTQGLNTFDMETLARCVWTLVKKYAALIEDEQKRCHIDRIVATLLGDMVSGIIHEELRETNEVSMPQTAQWTGILLAEAVDLLIQWTGLPFEIPKVPGNHGRLKTKMEFKRPDDSWDYVVYQVMRERLRNHIEAGNVTFDLTPRWYDSFEAQGRLYVITHGMQVRSQMGIPFYGLRRLVAQLLKQQNRVDQKAIDTERSIQRVGIDKVIIGHFHTPAVFDECIINGTLKGVDEYSTANAFTPVDRIQYAFMVDSEWGVCGIEPLNLNDPAPEHGWTLPELYR